VEDGEDVGVREAGQRGEARLPNEHRGEAAMLLPLYEHTVLLLYARCWLVSHGYLQGLQHRALLAVRIVDRASVT
jgi:hypothetical protein